jgi:uncharacterized protein (TIGR03435 family)
MVRFGILSSVTLMALCAIGQKASAPAFDVASIKLSTDPTRSASIGPVPGGRRFRATNMPLLWLITSAYDVSIRQVSGLPNFLSSKSYDIDATCGQPASRA